MYKEINIEKIKTLEKDLLDTVSEIMKLMQKRCWILDADSHIE